MLWSSIIVQESFSSADIAEWNSCITYIIGHYNPSIRIIDIVSHTTYVVC